MDLDTIKTILIILIISILLGPQYARLHNIVLQKILRRNIRIHQEKAGDMRMYLSSRDYIRWHHLIQKNIWTKEECKSMAGLFSKGVLFVDYLETKDPVNILSTINLSHMLIQFEKQSHMKVADLIDGDLKQKWLNEVNFIEECYLPIIANCLIDAINQYHKMDTSHG